jgi:hypothetical protein
MNLRKNLEFFWENPEIQNKAWVNLEKTLGKT